MSEAERVKHCETNETLRGDASQPAVDVANAWSMRNMSDYQRCCHTPGCCINSIHIIHPCAAGALGRY